MLTSNDFTGYYHLPFDNRTKILIDDLILRIEKEYLVKLFGYKLYQLFISDLGSNPTPTAARFVDIWGDLCLLNSNVVKCTNGGVLCSNGIKTMLKGLIYFHYVNDYEITPTQTGVLRNKNENSELPNKNYTLEMIEERYNKSVISFNAIADYMQFNSSVYPEYSGQKLKSIHWGGAF